MVTEGCGGMEEGGGGSAGLYRALTAAEATGEADSCLQFLLAQFPPLAPCKCVKVVLLGASPHI